MEPRTVAALLALGCLVLCGMTSVVLANNVDSDFAELKGLDQADDFIEDDTYRMSKEEKNEAKMNRLYLEEEFLKIKHTSRAEATGQRPDKRQDEEGGPNCTIDDQTYTNQTFSNRSFNNCTFIDCTFTDCTFTNCTFSNRDIISATFTNCTFNNCTFTNNNLDNCTFISCIFNNRSFFNCNFTSSTFTTCTFPECNFNNSTFTTTTFTPLNVQDCT